MHRSIDVVNGSAPLRWQRLVAAAAVSLLLLAPQVSRAQATSLAWKLTPGQKLQVTRDQLTVSQTSIAAKPLQTSVETSVVMTWTVSEVNAAGEATITQTLDQITARMDAGNGVVVYNSALPGKPTGAARSLADGVAPLVGESFQVVMTPRGEFVSVVPSEKIAALLSGKKEKRDATDAFSAEGIAKLLKQPLALLPDQPVAVGDSWQQQRELSVATFGGPLQQTLDYTLVKVGEENLMEIEMQGSITPPPAKGNVPRLKASELTGKAKFDQERGLLREMTAKQSLEVTSVFANSPLVVKTESRVTTKVTLQ